MGCEDARGLFLEYYDGGDMGAEFCAHLRECAACAAEFEEYRRVADEVRALPEPALPAGFHGNLTETVRRHTEARARRQRRAPYIRFALAAAASLILAIIWFSGVFTEPGLNFVDDAPEPPMAPASGAPAAEAFDDGDFAMPAADSAPFFEVRGNQLEEFAMDAPGEAWDVPAGAPGEEPGEPWVVGERDEAWAEVWGAPAADAPEAEMAAEYAAQAAEAFDDDDFTMRFYAAADGDFRDGEAAFGADGEALGGEAAFGADGEALGGEAVFNAAGEPLGGEAAFNAAGDSVGDDSTLRVRGAADDGFVGGIPDGGLDLAAGRQLMAAEPEPTAGIRIWMLIAGGAILLGAGLAAAIIFSIKRRRARKE